MTIGELVQMAKEEGYSMDTDISIMGADVQYTKFTREYGHEVVILDDCPIDDEEEE